MKKKITSKTVFESVEHNSSNVTALNFDCIHGENKNNLKLTILAKSKDRTRSLWSTI